MGKYMQHHSVLYRKLKAATNVGPIKKGIKIVDYIKKYCEVNKIPLPALGKKSIRQFIQMECNRIGSPLYTNIALKN